MEIAWLLQESMDISVHTLMRIVHTFSADLNVKLNIFLVKTPSVQTFQYIHLNIVYLQKVIVNDYTTHLLNLIP